MSGTIRTCGEGTALPSLAKHELALPKNSDCALGATVMPAKAGIQAGRLRGCLVDSRFRGHDEFGTQLSSWAKPYELVEA
jgi:hypothetical protein